MFVGNDSMCFFIFTRFSDLISRSITMFPMIKKMVMGNILPDKKNGSQTDMHMENGIDKKMVVKRLCTWKMA